MVNKSVHYKGILKSYLAVLILTLATICSSDMDASALARQGEPDAYIAVSWSPDGQYIATVDSSRNIKVFDAGTGSPSQILLQRDLDLDSVGIASVEWSPDGTKLAATDLDKIQIWRTSDWSLQVTIDDSSFNWWSLSWSPDSTQLASVTYGGPTRSFRIWDPSNGQLIREMDSGGFLYAVSWSPDGEMLAVPNGDGVSIWYPSNDLPQSSFGRLGGDLISADWSPDSSRVAVLGDDSSIFVWNVDTATLALTLDGQGREYFMSSVRWSPDGTRIASVSDDGTLWVWDAETGDGVQVAQEAGPLYAVDWSPDSTQIVYGGQNATLEIIDAPEFEDCDHDIPASDTATLISTITTANGSGNPTTICLAQDSTYTFTTANNYLNAMPYITGDITIEGQNATITRSGTEAFRFFEVETGGKLTLNDLTLSNGDVSDERGGQLILNNVTFVNNPDD